MSARAAHAAVAMIATLVVLVAACGSGDGEGADGGAVDGSGLPTTTYADDIHQEQVDDVADMIDRAQGDLCILAEANPSFGPTPGTSEQVRMTVGAWSDWLVAVSGSLEATAPESAAALSELAQQLPVEAAGQDYRSDFWELTSTREMVDATEVTEAFRVIETERAACAEAQPTTTIGA